MPSNQGTSSNTTMKFRRFLASVAAASAMLFASSPSGLHGSPVAAAAAATAELDAVSSPKSLTFASAGADSQQIVLMGPAADGTLTASSADVKIVTVTTVPKSAHATSQMFTVSPAGVGSSAIVITSTSGAKLNVPVTVLGVDSGDANSRVNGSNIGVIAGVGAVVAIAALIGFSHNGSSAGPAATAPPIPTPTPTPVSVSTGTPTPAPTTTPTMASSATATPTPTPTGAPTTTATPTALPSGATPNPTPSPTPTPVPTNTPSPAPTLTAGPLQVNPNQLDFVVGSGTTTGNFTAAETGYTGVFTVSSGNTAVATVAPGSGSGPSQMFTVTEQGPGTTTITVMDSKGNSAQVTVTVTATGVTVNSRGRREAAPASPRHR